MDQPGRNSNALGLRRLREDLSQILTAAASAWQVNGDGTGLVRQVDETACAALDRAATAAGDAPRSGSADKQIRAAWRTLYKLEPEPETAYREAVKAVESVAHAVIQSNHADATLGSPAFSSGRSAAMTSRTARRSPASLLACPTVNASGAETQAPSHRPRQQAPLMTPASGDELHLDARLTGRRAAPDVLAGSLLKQERGW